MEEQVRYYKANIIYIMTIIFGPCAGGLMIGNNFFNMGKRQAGWLSIFLSVLLVFFLMFLVAVLPERISNAIPQLVLPAIWGGISYLIVDKTQQPKLIEHTEKKGLFYSNWKALGVGLIGLLMAALIGLLVFWPLSWQSDRLWDEMQQHENKAFGLFEMVDNNASDEEMIVFIDSVGFTSWDNFQKVVSEMEKTAGKSDAEVEQIKLLKKYAALRKQEMQYIYNMLKGKADYDMEIAKLRQEIDEVLAKLSAL